MREQISNNNFDDVLRRIYSCNNTETEFVFSHSQIDSSRKIRELFAVLSGLPQAVKLKFDHCKFNEADEELMLEFKLCLGTNHNIREFVLSDSIMSANSMDYLATALCRNRHLKMVVINGVVNEGSQAMLDLKGQQIAIINGVSYLPQQKPGLFTHRDESQQHDVTTQQQKKSNGSQPSV